MQVKENFPSKPFPSCIGFPALICNTWKKEALQLLLCPACLCALRDFEPQGIHMLFGAMELCRVGCHQELLGLFVTCLLCLLLLPGTVNWAEEPECWICLFLTIQIRPLYLRHVFLFYLLPESQRLKYSHSSSFFGEQGLGFPQWHSDSFWSASLPLSTVIAAHSQWVARGIAGTQGPPSSAHNSETTWHLNLYEISSRQHFKTPKSFLTFTF